MVVPWQDRLVQISSHIPGKARVVDIGAGEQNLSKFIDRTCEYIPVDKVARTSPFENIVCDLDASPECILEIGRVDYAVCSGAIEYIENVETLLHTISQIADNIVVSYNPSEYTTNKYRRGQGWVNDYHSKDIIEIVKNAGYIITSAKMNSISKEIIIFGARKWINLV